MIFVVSGEGPTDIGACTNGRGTCMGQDFRIGPMGRMIDTIVAPIAGYSLHDNQALEFVSETHLARLTKGFPMTLSAGKKRGHETAFFFKGARAMARIAKQREQELGCPAGAVMFRDADGTRSTERGLYDDKWNSIESGFIIEEFQHGVPMIPKPKSEAWLLCALKQHPYQNCAGLENSLSGNDHSPNPAKAQLELRLNERNENPHDLADMVNGGQIDYGRITMPSFDRFRQRLETVTRSLLGLPP